MIIWINGAFGSGKTQTAYELHRRIKNSYVYDPENIGFFIRDNVPHELKNGDFQNYCLWRTFNFDMLSYIAKNYDGIIIVPMTITNRQYYDEIIGELLKKFTIRHFILSAKKETILKRLGRRFETKNSWAAQQIDRCIEAFSTSITEIKIQTDDMTIDEVIQEIAKQCNIKLSDDNRNKFQKTWGRVITQFKYIR